MLCCILLVSFRASQVWLWAQLVVSQLCSTTMWQVCGSSPRACYFCPLILSSSVPIRLIGCVYYTVGINQIHWMTVQGTQLPKCENDLHILHNHTRCGAAPRTSSLALMEDWASSPKLYLLWPVHEWRWWGLGSQVENLHLPILLHHHDFSCFSCSLALQW